jgi:hypothetical protein
MNRRRYLSSLVLGSSLLAGCSSSTESNSSPSSTPTATPTERQPETPTRTPEPPDTEVTEEPLNIQHLHGISGQTYPPDIDGNHFRRYEWSAAGVEWWIEREFPRALGEYYKSRFGRNPNFDIYVTDGYGADYISSIAREFEGFKEDYDLSQREMVNVAVAFVQSMEYTPDDVSKAFDQYTSYPVETLIDRGGDCEDSTILLAAILREMGYGCVLLGMWDAEHMALGVMGDTSVEGAYYEYNGERYYFVETTGEGLEIGEVPEFAQDERAEIIEISQSPTMVYGYETEYVEDENSITVDVWIGNFGRRMQEGYDFFAEFVDQNESAQASDRIFVEPLSREEEMRASLSLRPPENVTLRLSTGLMIDDTLLDFDQSDWKEPI